MATIAMMVGGAIVNAVAFSGSNWLFSSLKSKQIDEERLRHDKPSSNSTPPMRSGAGEGQSTSTD
jgi:hypothetical protein